MFNFQAFQWASYKGLRLPNFYANLSDAAILANNILQQAFDKRQRLFYKVKLIIADMSRYTIFWRARNRIWFK